MAGPRSVLVATMQTRPVTWFMSRYIDAIDGGLRRVSGGRVSIARLLFPELVLHTVGAKSGKPRENTLLYAEHDGLWHVVGTNFGGDAHPGWTYNLLANPDARAEVGGRSVDVRAEQLSPDEMAVLWPRFDAVYPGYAGYRETVGDRRAIRMFRLVPR